MTEPTLDDIYAALGRVVDPELGVDIVTLGLVYDVSFVDGKVDVAFTLTTRGCPLGHVIREGIVNALSTVPGVVEVTPRLVWKPRWDPRRVKDGVF